MSERLPARWDRWRRKRRDLLIAEGLRSGAANKLALREARARSMAEDVVGRRAAELAVVAFPTRDDGSTRTVVMGHREDLPTERHQQFFELLHLERPFLRY